MRAECYFGYHNVFRYTDEPFTSLVPDALFNICRFLMSASMKSKEAPLGVSKIYTIFCLAKQARHLGAYKLARHCLDKLQSLHIPPAWREQIDFASVTIRSLPFSDKEQLLPVCYRCGTTNPLISANCVACGHEFVRSFCSFDVLPLVEFVLENSVSDEEAAKLIAAQPSQGKDSRHGHADRWQERDAGGFQAMGMGDSVGNDGAMGAATGNDLFSRQLMSGDASEISGPVVVDRHVLASLDAREVFSINWFGGKTGLRPRYYKSVVPEIPIILCSTCNKFFHEEDFEFATLVKKECPFCKTDCAAM